MIASTRSRLAQEVKMMGSEIARVASMKKLGKAQPVRQALTTFDIVEHIIDWIDDDLSWARVERDYYNAVRLKTLYRLLFVCRTWYPVILRKLYTSLSFEAMPVETYNSPKQRNSHALHKTLIRNPSLCLLVKRLRLDAGYVNVENSDGENQVPLPNPLRLCKGVKHLEITVEKGIPAEQLHFIDMLKEYDLVDFRLELDKATVLRDTRLFSASSIIPCIWHWQHLREIQILKVFEAEDKEWLLPDPSSVKGRCPSLRKIDMTVFQTGHSKYGFSSCLLLLSEAAPYVEDLSYRVMCTEFLVEENAGFTDAIATCLGKWSPTLQRLELYCPSLSTKLSPVVLSLECLRDLFIDASVVPPSDLFRLRDLEKITYYMDDDDLREIVNHFTGEIVFRKLKSLAFYLYTVLGLGDWPRDVDMSAIPRTCKARGIRYTLSLT